MASQPSLKILYGVQATGEGHLTRAEHMARALAAEGADIHFLISGKPRAALGARPALGDFETRRGWTFDNKDGRVQRLRTLFNTSALGRVLYDAARLDTEDYDLVITDFEPITSLAARMGKVPSLGIGHHHAFDFAVPKTGFTAMESKIMQIYAPARTQVGLHFYHWGQPILPPIVKRPVPDGPVQDNKIVVYLGFENLRHIAAMLAPLTGHEFHIYHKDAKREDAGHLRFWPTMRDGSFQRDAATAGGLLTGGGFEAPAENLDGKRILLKPQGGQPEQASNALALKQLGLGQTMTTLDTKTVAAWLASPPGPRVDYPDTAAALARWIVENKRDWRDVSPLIKPLWAQVRGLEHLRGP